MIEKLSRLDSVHTFFPVHDVHQPAFDECCILSTITTSHRNPQILAVVTDGRDRADEVLLSR